MSLVKGLLCHLQIQRLISTQPAHVIRNRTRGFLDYLLVTTKAGNGGDGAVMFTSEWLREFCGPDGGNGGNGSHIILRANGNVHSLAGIPPVINGKSGASGGSKGCAGKSADHVIIDVPVGTVVYEVCANNSQKVIGDLSADKDFLVVARGGAGGRGNRAFLTNEQRAPAFAEKGGRGEQRRIAIEMKLIADVGLIGMPNAGKSSLLNALSRARPKIAAYPFTTLKPHIGTIELPNASHVSVADLPGIIEGAHENRGLGLSFLRHIERCRVLLYVIDLSNLKPDPVAQFEMLRSELESYNPALLNQREGAIVANKIDVSGAADAPLAKLKRHCLNLPVIAVSAKYNGNIAQLRKFVVEMFSEK